MLPTWEDVRKAGFTCKDAKEAGFKPWECAQAGYSYQETGLEDWMANFFFFGHLAFFLWLFIFLWLFASLFSLVFYGGWFSLRGWTKLALTWDGWYLHFNVSF